VPQDQDLKSCPGCSMELPIEQFQQRIRLGQPQLRPRCRRCERKQERDRSRRRKPYRDEYRKAYYAKNRESSIAATKQWQKENHDKNKATKLHYRYGVTPESYDSMYVEQLGRCSVCRDVLPYQGKGCHIDHDHVSGIVRALLCLGCNVGIGHFRERPELMRAAASYIEAHAA
jgi:hypothetical protein